MNDTKYTSRFSGAFRTSRFIRKNDRGEPELVTETYFAEPEMQATHDARLARLDAIGRVVDKLAQEMRDAAQEAVSAKGAPRITVAFRRFENTTSPSDVLAILDDRAALSARVEELERALAETLAVATRNEEGDFADRARAALNRLPQTQQPPQRPIKDAEAAG